MLAVTCHRAEPTGGLGRDQVLHHRLVDEREPAGGVPAQGRPRTEQMGGLGRGEVARVPHRLEHLAGNHGQSGHIDERCAVAPQRHSQLGDGDLPFADR